MNLMRSPGTRRGFETEECEKSLVDTVEQYFFDVQSSVTRWRTADSQSARPL